MVGLLNLEEELKRLEKIKKMGKPQQVSSVLPLPPPSMTSNLVKNYGTFKEIVELIKDENVALDKAVNEVLFPC